MNNTVNQDRARFNRSIAIDLNTNAATWKKVVFNGTSPDNYNTFGMNDATKLRMLDWDAVNEKFVIYGDYDSNFLMGFYPVTNATLITTKSVLQFRIAVPNGGGPGVTKYFPYGDDATPYVDMGEVTLLAGGVRHVPVILPVTATALIRANGFWVECRLSNALVTLGQCTMTSAYITFLSTR